MDDLTRQLAQLEDVQLVRRLADDDSAYQFKHVLAQETTYQSLLVKTRRDIHLRVAHYYEHLSAATPASNAEILAHHYFEGGDLAKTFHYSLLAGDAAARLYAHPEALMYYDRALEMIHRLSGASNAQVLTDDEIAALYTNRGRVYELSNRYDLASENYMEMEKFGRATGNHTLELSGMTLRAILLATYTSEFDPVRGSELSAQILERAQEIGDRAVEARIHWIMLLLAKYGDGNIEQAIVHGERSLELARALGLRELIAYTLNDLAAPYGAVSRFDATRAVLEEAIGIWKELGNLAMLSDTIANLIQVHYYAGDMEQTMQASSEALRLSQMTGSLWGQAYSQMWIGSMLAEVGEYGAALKVMQEVLHTSETANFLPPQVATRIDYAWLLGEVGLLEQAMQEAERASTLLQDIQPFAMFVLTVRIRLALLAGDLNAAEQIAAQTSDAPESPFKNDPDGMARITFYEAELALAQQDYARAFAALDSAINFFKANHVVAFLPEALFLKARVLDAQGDAESAIAILSDALDASKPLPSRRMQWQILAMWSELEARRGHLEMARELRTQAREVVEYMSRHLGSAEWESAFLSLPRVRALFQEN